MVRVRPHCSRKTFIREGMGRPGEEDGATRLRDSHQKLLYDRWYFNAENSSRPERHLIRKYVCGGLRIDRDPSAVTFDTDRPLRPPARHVGFSTPTGRLRRGTTAAPANAATNTQRPANATGTRPTTVGSSTD